MIKTWSLWSSACCKLCISPPSCERSAVHLDRNNAASSVFLEGLYILFETTGALYAHDSRARPFFSQPEREKITSAPDWLTGAVLVLHRRPRRFVWKTAGWGGDEADLHLPVSSQTSWFDESSACLDYSKQDREPELGDWETTTEAQYASSCKRWFTASPSILKRDSIQLYTPTVCIWRTSEIILYQLKAKQDRKRGRGEVEGIPLRRKGPGGGRPHISRVVSESQLGNCSGRSW